MSDATTAVPALCPVAEPAPMTGWSTPLDTDRVARAKRAFTTRNVELFHATQEPRWSITGGRPMVGDLVLARVVALGEHRELERPDGRKATLYPGDEIIVAYGDRYAPDQYEGVVPDDLGPCDLIAKGGMAGHCLSHSVRVGEPTRLEPLGLLAADGQLVNLRAHTKFPVGAEPALRPAHTVGVIGTSMNAGKTTSLAALVRGLSWAGLRVGAAKITGTGAGNDLWLYRDAGAEWITDFTDAGYPSTYRVPINELEEVAAALVDGVTRLGAEVVVIEIADGVFQQETAALIASPQIRMLLDGVLFAAGEALGAVSGAERLRDLGYDIRAVTGLFTASPLAAREVAARDLPVLGPPDLMDPEIALRLLSAVREIQAV